MCILRNSWFIVLGAAIAVMGCSASGVPGELYITGEGSIMAEYDMVQFEMQLEAEVKNISNGNAASLAQSRASNATQELLKALQDEVGIPISNITTSSINVSPISKYNDGESTVIGYDASVSFLVKTSANQTRVTDLVAEFSSEGINVQVFAFKPYISDEAQKTYEQDLFDNTMENAKSKAQMFARGAERKLGAIMIMSDRPIVITSDSSNDDPVGPYNRAVTTAPMASVPDPSPTLPLGKGEKLTKKIYLKYLLD